MRSAFIRSLVELAERDPRVVLLTGDLGFTVIEDFAERFPDRFFNVGVAEQNMLGVATGLAEAGFVPFVYSIATFATMRPYEFIRNGPLLHDLPVRVVGVGTGLDYGNNGVTHFALEDVALMRVQPRMMIVAPADPDQAQAAVDATSEVRGPIYFRVGKGAISIPELGGRFTPGRAELLRDGGDIAIVALGAAARIALDAADLLALSGIEAAVAVVSSFNPSPTADIAGLLDRVPAAITVEAHYVNGGLGSFVAEVVAEHGLDVRLTRSAVREMPCARSGTQQYLLEHYGLTPRLVADSALTSLALDGS
ncbi:MAG: transketolase C-terminal domain-containing protein [Gaiellaceae bacterium]